MAHFIVNHHHRGGVSSYGVKSNKNLTGFYNEDNPLDEIGQTIIESIDIEFEPDRGEILEIMEICPDFILI